MPTQLSMALLFAFASASAALQDLPAGAGKQALERICTGCHEIDTVVTVRRTKTDWQQMVDDMVTRGATGSDKEVSAIVAYLTSFFGKINVNTEPAAELEKFLGIAGKEAQAIVDYRDKNGKFKDFEQLTKVPGVSADKLREKKELIAFNR